MCAPPPLPTCTHVGVTGGCEYVQVTVGCLIKDGGGAWQGALLVNNAVCSLLRNYLGSSMTWKGCA